MVGIFLASLSGMQTVRSLVTLVVVSVAACADVSVDEQRPAERSVVERHHLYSIRPNVVDVLFVVDRSMAMSALNSRLKENRIAQAKRRAPVSCHQVCQRACAASRSFFPKS
jgi:hypothetical protein